MELLISILIIVVVAYLIIWAAENFVPQIAYPVKLVVGLLVFIFILRKLWPLLSGGHLF